MNELIYELPALLVLIAFFWVIIWKWHKLAEEELRKQEEKL